MCLRHQDIHIGGNRREKESVSERTELRLCEILLRNQVRWEKRDDHWIWQREVIGIFPQRILGGVLEPMEWVMERLWSEEVQNSNTDSSFRELYHERKGKWEDVTPSKGYYSFVCSFVFFFIGDCHLPKESDLFCSVTPLLKMLFCLPIETWPASNSHMH